MRRIFLTVLIGAGLGIGAASAASVVVKVAPPHAIVETRPARPGPNYVWVNGYHRWDGNAYHWESGRWEVPPHAHARWISPRWEHHHDGYVFIEGRWR